MSGCVIIQTCDAYQHLWAGLAFSMNRYWDYNIPWPIYFCNEEAKVFFPDGVQFRQIQTGKGNYADRLLTILDAVSEFDYVFYMIEDFWPTDRMTKEFFTGLANLVEENQWKCLRVSILSKDHHNELELSPYVFQGKPIFQYKKSAEWKFMQQSSIWDRKFLREIVAGAKKCEIVESTSLGTEAACDVFLRQNYPDVPVYFYHYYWYPVSGVSWRGELNLIGRQIEYLMHSEDILQQRFGEQFGINHAGLA